MAQTASNVTAAKPKVAGAINVAPVGTTLPTDAVTALAEAFKGLGYVDENGLVNSGVFSPEGIKAWGKDTVLTLDNGDGETYKFKLIEATNVEVLKFVFGENKVTGTLETGIKIEKGDYSRPEQVLVVDMILRDNALKRIVVPKAIITSVSDIVYKDNEVVGYEVTIKANKDSNDRSSYEYIKATGATGATG